MSLESEIIKAGQSVVDRSANKRTVHQEMDTDSAFRQEQLLKKEKIGDAAAAVVMQAEQRASTGDPLSKKELANLCIDALAQLNFETPDDQGKLVDRDMGSRGSTFSLPEYDYYMALIETATEGVPIKAKGSQVTTDGVKPMSAERFRNIFEGALRKLRARVSDDPEMKEVLPQYLKEKQTGMPTPLSVPKLDNFTSLSQFIERHS